MIAELTGHAMHDHGWIPHKPETWKYRFATLRKPVEMWYYNPRATTEEEKFNKVLRDAGTRVKIVMVSRFGDVGITDDLTAENGYDARVPLDSLCNFKTEV